MKLAIVIPAFNEAGRIEATVRSAKPYGTPLVIDDGSTDNTADLAKAAGADVIRLSPNQGYDQALNAGFKAAAERDFDCVITFDADGQHPEQALTRVHQHLKTGCELVVGKRHKKARWSEKLFGLYTRVRFGVSDPLCGMKGYQLALFNRYKVFDSYGSTGTELMLRGLKAGSPMAEVEIRVHEREDQPRFGSFIKANVKIVRSMVRSLIYIR